MGTRGFLIFALNSEKINYVRLAVMCSLAIKSNLQQNDVTLITDDDSIKYMKKHVKQSLVTKCFDNIVVVDYPWEKNTRKHFNSPYTQFKTDFKNFNRADAYSLSPYDETILIDCDYIVMDNSFDKIWNNNHDFLANKKVCDLLYNPPNDDDTYVNKFGIPLYWATIVYFKKTSISKSIFDLMRYIRKNYAYFKFLYSFTSSVYRNDYSMSIAIHILNGFIDSQDLIKPFPHNTLKISRQQDLIEDVKKNQILFLSNKPLEQWKNIPVNLKNTSVHIMNKRELANKFFKFVEVYNV